MLSKYGSCTHARLKNHVCRKLRIYCVCNIGFKPMKACRSARRQSSWTWRGLIYL